MPALPVPSSWRRFLTAFVAVLAPAALALYAFVLVLDPYGVRASPARPATPIMDLNQRFMYPQIVRSGRFDAAVVGTSTMRLLDPARLSAAFGARFTNLGLNAGTPWEQVQLAGLFLRKTPNPKVLVWGLDRTWCEADADRPEKRITFRAFPPWLYDDNDLNDFSETFNLKALEIAGRVALHRLGLMPERIRADGYEVFTPPEGAYDAARARAHLWGDGPGRVVPQTPPVILSPAEEAALAFPALAWLDAALAAGPAGLETILALPPVHVAAQAAPGSEAAARDGACKARIAAIAERHGAVLVDFRRPSPVTATDENYWDPLHYRLPVAERFADALRQAAVTGEDAADGFYRVLTRGPPPRS